MFVADSNATFYATEGLSFLYEYRLNRDLCLKTSNPLEMYLQQQSTISSFSAKMP